MSRPDAAATPDVPTLFGHPAGLYTLFFAEMWERFSFYGMRALLTLYLVKGFLQYNDSVGYTVYGAYTALVYMTPFFGGMLADRLLGARRAVILGGLLMAAGAVFLMLKNTFAFYSGLGLIIVGNGFFKPNISNIVGTLYRQFPEKRDGGFTIFYIGINLGAALAPLLCGYIGEKGDWADGFGLATVGMLVGLAVFVVAPWMAQIIIGGGAIAGIGGLLIFHPSEPISIVVSVFVAAALAVSATVAILAIRRGGLPADAGAPPDPTRLKRRLLGVLPVEWAVYLGAVVLVPCFMLLVSGGAPLRQDNCPWTFADEATIKSLETSDDALQRVAAVLLRQISTPAGIVLTVATLLAYGYLLIETFRMDTVARHRMGVVLILTFFCMLFWAFFEQAGSSISNFTDRNVDRVFDRATLRNITVADVGKTIEIEPTQEQLGFYNGAKLFTLDVLTRLREDYKTRRASKEYAESPDARKNGEPVLTIPWKVTEADVGMNIASQESEIPASQFQAVNPIYILLLGLAFTALWTFLGTHGWEPSTPFKFALGLLQLGLGFVALWYGTRVCDSRGMVAVWWLLLAYLLHTTAELCLSPVGLAMITKLSPARLVSTVMGGWFLATAVSQFLGGIIAQFTRVGDSEVAAAAAVIPPPIETVHVYGHVYGIIAIAAGIAAAVCFCLVPLLKKWMHEGEP